LNDIVFRYFIIFGLKFKLKSTTKLIFEKMKKVISSLAIAAIMTFGISNVTIGQEKDTTKAAETAVTTAAKEGATSTEETAEEEVQLDFVQTLKQKYIEGDPLWMTPVLICMIIGMALAIERVVYLNLATINTKKFLDEVESALKSGGTEAAKEVCRNTRGPIASIYYQGLDRASEGIDMVEKSVVSYGGVQMGMLEKGLSWISLFIALAPMLGFLGTVIGMIQAFDKIVKDGQVSPTTVADGIKVALLTTVFGLIAAMVLQVFYNYILAKIDGLVNEMEDTSITLIDMLLKNKAA
jgi:biopolymer transport protein ExbB